MRGAVHEEKHFTASESVRDVVIGMADGLTVPFALAAGLSGAVKSTGVIVVAGLAEIAAGSIAMGLGGYLAARTDREHYTSERAREWREVREMPAAERQEVAAVFREYGLDDERSAPVVDAICSDADRWVDFMMRYELGLEAPDPGRAARSALTIGASYVAGGLVPLVPYMAADHVLTGLAVSAAVTLLALFSFGAVKGRLTGVPPLRGGLQTVTIGGIAAAAAFAIARWIG
jgi:VIT1/CCC1 family predicted Fe2+/Mn2+ transporter